MSYNILDYLENSAQKYPCKVAFADAEAEITFDALRQGAGTVGSALAQLTAPRAPIAFYMEKGVCAITGFMGAVYAGCFYVMLDVKHPRHRLQAVLNTLQAKLLVTDLAHIDAAKELGFCGDILLIEDLSSGEINLEALCRIRMQALDIDPLYAIFTSGSTGVPKGVVVSHRSTIDFIDAFTGIFNITNEDVLANQAPFDFDVSVKDIYSGLATGATVQIIPRSYFSFPTKLMDFLCMRQVTVLVWAVSALCFVTTMKGLEYKLPLTIRLIMFSGELMPVKHLNIWRSFLPKAQYVNLYGPTEITCNCTYHVLNREYLPEETLPIGKPFPNEKVFLLNEADLQINEPDTLGEICVSGTALSLGYYNDAPRTAEAFVQNPLNKSYLELIYRTGDLGRYDTEGNLVYVTRKDFQIKHMGHRIELGEIETAMGALAGVVRACCLYNAEKQRIIAFYEGEADKKQIMRSLKDILPMFMLPNSLVQKEVIPLTKNGKIDRALLMGEL